MIKFLLFSIVLFSCINVYAQKEYSIVTKFRDLHEMMEAEYWISRTTTNDSLYLGKILTHDWPQPNFYFLANDVVAYEWGGESSRTINVRDLKKDSLLCSVPGFIAVRLKWAEKYIDRTSNILFFNQTRGSVTDLMALDLNTLKARKILTYKTDFTIEVPLIEVNSNKRTLIVNYSSEEGQRFSDTAAY